MKVENNSHFIKYWINKGKEFAKMRHYREVWEDGFTVDDFHIDTGGISFEAASWNFISPNGFYPGTWIPAKQYNRWVDDINRTKNLLINMGRGAGTATVKELKTGDFVFCTVPPYDTEDEYEHTWYCFLDIVSAESDYIYAKELMIDVNYFCYSNEVKKIQKEEEYWLSEALESNGVQLVNKSVFHRAIEIFKPLTSKIMSEIKEKVEHIET